MSTPLLRPRVHRPLSIDERTLRFRERMIASALVRLEDWSPLPIRDNESEGPVEMHDRIPPVRFPPGPRPTRRTH